jgi:hypothetical protein
VRGKRRRADRQLEDALAALRRALDATRVPWMVIGGIATIVRGVRRLTTDIDALVEDDGLDVATLIAALGARAIQPRIPDAARFARANAVLLVRHQPSGVDLDVALGRTGFEREALAARVRATYGTVRVPMARADDLVILKAMAARPKDIEDAIALLVLHPAIDVARVRRRLAELAELADEPELVTGLEDILARALSYRKRRR